MQIFGEEIVRKWQKIAFLADATHQKTSAPTRVPRPPHAPQRF